MKRVLLVTATTGYQARAFDAAAERFGIELVFATDRCHVLEDPWRDRAVAIRFEDPAAAVTTIVETAGPIDGVLAVGDRPTIVAARAAAALGLRWHSVEAARAARNKRTTRQRLAAAGLPTPRTRHASLDISASALGSHAEYPAVIKPLALSASRGVMRVNDEQELAVALDRLRAILASPELQAEQDDAHRFVLFEEFIEGEEFAIEAIMDRGVLHPVALFDKPDPLNGPFFEETIYVTPSRQPDVVQQAILRAVERAATAIGLSHGPVHAECRVNARGVFVLEVAARPIGGLCARVVRMAAHDSETTVPFEEVLLRHAAGEPIAGWRRERSSAGVMMVPIPRRGILRSVSGEAGARAVSCIDEVQITAKLDQILVPLPEGASYLGFIFARADTPARVEQALGEAHACLRFDIQPEMRVLQSTHG